MLGGGIAVGHSGDVIADDARPANSRITEEAVQITATGPQVPIHSRFRSPNLLHFPHSKLSAADNRGAHAEAFAAWAEIAPVRLTVPFGF
jgi:hypothetical protein